MDYGWFIQDVSLHSGELPQNHRKELQTRLYNRRRATICGVPKILNTHNSEPHKKDRCVSVQVALKVKDLYGILIPVGTGKLMGCGGVHTNIGKEVSRGPVPDPETQGLGVRQKRIPRHFPMNGSGSGSKFICPVSCL